MWPSSALMTRVSKKLGGSGATFWRREPLIGSCFWEPFLEPPPAGGSWNPHNVEASGAAPREPGAVFGAVFHDYIKRI